MRMSTRTIGFLILLVVSVAVISILVRSRSGDPIESAAPLTEPVTRDVAAEFGWQGTGILLESGERINIQFLSGEIRDGETVLRGPSGSGYVCGDSTCCEPMPAVPRAALIGRVRDQLFPIGDTSTIEVKETGELQLRINDCDEGLFDNSGSLMVKISR
jgi:hypothetical protein